MFYYCKDFDGLGCSFFGPGKGIQLSRLSSVASMAIHISVLAGVDAMRNKPSRTAGF
jgi:hypothetical protein